MLMLLLFIICAIIFFGEFKRDKNKESLFYGLFIVLFILVGLFLWIMSYTI